MQCNFDNRVRTLRVAKSQDHAFAQIGSVELHREPVAGIACVRQQRIPRANQQVTDLAIAVEQPLCTFPVKIRCIGDPTGDQ